MTHEIFKNTVFCLKDEMYRFAKRFVISSDEAEDVVQDLMMKFWQKKEELAAFGNLKSYALKSVKNECLNRLKHEDVKMGFADFQKHRSEIHEFESNNMKDQIIGFINALPEKQKAVIHLKDVEDCRNWRNSRNGTKRSSRKPHASKTESERTNPETHGFRKQND